MAGEAHSLQFLLGSATVMVGAVDDLWQLRPETHSLGLVKNFQFSADPTYVDLSYRTGGAPIFSVRTALACKISMDVFEHTARNLQLALGNLPINVEPISKSYQLYEGADGLSYATFMSDTDDHADFFGQWILIQGSQPDVVHVAEVETAYVIGTGPFEITVSFPGQPIQPGNDFPAGSMITCVNVLNVGTPSCPAYLSAKVIGQSSGTAEPIGVIFPKVRIDRGFDIKFDATKYSSLPFSIKPFPLVASDINYTEFADLSVAKIFTRYQYADTVKIPVIPPTPILEYKLVTRQGRTVLLRNGRTLMVRAR